MAVSGPAWRRHGSFTVEYAIMGAVLTAALLGMLVYVQRGLSGKWREVGDSFGHGRQFEPGVTK